MQQEDEKNLLQKFGLKKVPVKFMSMVDYIVIIFQVNFITCKLPDHLKL